MSQIDLTSIQVDNDSFSDDEDEFIQEETANDSFDNSNESLNNKNYNENYEDDDNEDEDYEDDNEDRYGYERRKKILILQFYLNEFPIKLKNYLKINLEELSDKELLLLREEMSFVIGAKSNVNMGIGVISQGLTIFETIGSSYGGLKINGLTNTLMNDQSFIDDIKSLCLDNLDIANISPEKRIAFKVLSTGYILHNVNSQLEKQKQQEQPPQEQPDYQKLNKLQKINTKYNDL